MGDDGCGGGVCSPLGHNQRATCQKRATGC
nr:MAG TPA: hypothetical protein [Caudoviricetes sp.]